MAFNSSHTAFEAAINALLASGLCAEINLVQSPGFEVTDGLITGANYRFECVKRVEPTCTHTGQGAIRLTWDIPTSREDGTRLDLTEISGYFIAFGTSVSGLNQNVFVSGATNISHELIGLEPGTYFFQIATVDSDGFQGAFSAVIKQSI